MNDLYQPPQDSSGLGLTQNTRVDIAALSGWLWIMSIISFASIALTLVSLSVMLSYGFHSSMIVTLGGSLIGITYTLLNAIFLMQASRAYKSYIKTSNPYDLERGLKAQRNYFILLGVYVIFVLVIFVLGFIAATLGGLLVNR